MTYKTKPNFKTRVHVFTSTEPILYFNLVGAQVFLIDNVLSFDLLNTHTRMEDLYDKI